ncbi:MAG TPA: hypothetical protein VNG53_10795, partial [Bacteroidia bacterium]|nr:hypothetical protein [Bacteroidia bacterium]
MYSKAFRFIAFVSLPLLSITSFAQKKETKIILWKKDCPLTWTDFRPVEKKESNEVALTSCTIDSKFDQINKDTIEATIPCLF